MSSGVGPCGQVGTAALPGTEDGRAHPCSHPGTAHKWPLASCQPFLLFGFHSVPTAVLGRPAWVLFSRAPCSL